MEILYVDILLALNLFIDFLLLAATARVLQRPTKRFRLIGGALLGAVSSLAILLPPLPTVISVTYKLGIAAFMVGVAFPLERLSAFLKTTAVLFVISAVFSGLCAGGYYLLAPTGLFVQSGIVYYDVPPLLLVALTTASYLLLCMYDRLTRKRAALGFSYRVEITDGDTRVLLRALFDSGHSLCDSFSGAPVILVKTWAVNAFRDRYDAAMISGDRVGRMRYIPFSSIGGNGVLPAFRPASVILYGDHRSVDISGVWVAVTDVLGRGEYDALIGPALADRLS